MRKANVFSGGIYILTGQVLDLIVNIVIIYLLFLLKSFNYNQFRVLKRILCFSLVLSFSRKNIFS